MAEFTGKHVNLAAPEHGGAICSVSDEFFAPAKRMLAASAPVFMPDRYDQHGKWMDGWESRRKRGSGHDHCVVRICPGVVREIEIDTSHFTGNFPPEVSVEACRAEFEPGEQTAWTELVTRSVLQGDAKRLFRVSDKHSWTHIRLNIYPDGGIARLRVYGEPDQLTPVRDRDQWVDLASADVGGKAIVCNDMHFGHMDNLLSNRAVTNMGDGWETRRRREPGNDWVIIKLGCPGRIARVEVDTAFFRGNYPARCSLKGASPGQDDDLTHESPQWMEILPRVALGPNQLHVFESQVRAHDNVTHVRFDIYPDGGVARLRLRGIPTTAT